MVCFGAQGMALLQRFEVHSCRTLSLSVYFISNFCSPILCFCAKYVASFPRLHTRKYKTLAQICSIPSSWMPCSTSCILSIFRIMRSIPRPLHLSSVLKSYVEMYVDLDWFDNRTHSYRTLSLFVYFVSYFCPPKSCFCAKYVASFFRPLIHVNAKIGADLIDPFALDAVINLRSSCVLSVLRILKSVPPTSTMPVQFTA